MDKPESIGHCVTSVASEGKQRHDTEADELSREVAPKAKEPLDPYQEGYLFWRVLHGGC